MNRKQTYIAVSLTGNTPTDDPVDTTFGAKPNHHSVHQTAVIGQEQKVKMCRSPGLHFSGF